MHAREDQHGGPAAKPARPPVKARPSRDAAGLAPPGASVPAQLAALQGLVGNQVVARAVAEDRHEHGAGCGHDVSSVQRSPEEQQAGQSSLLDALRSPGRPLEPHIRKRTEQGYNMSFEHVRVHDNPVAQRAAVEFGARAMTVGSDIIVGPQGADDETKFHEVDHVYWNAQGRSVEGSDNGAGVKVSHTDAPSEKHAAANGRRMAQGAMPELSGPGTAAHHGTVQRAAEGSVGPVQRVEQDAITPAPAATAQQPAPAGNNLNAAMGSTIPDYWNDLQWTDSGNGYQTAHLPRGHDVWNAIEEYARRSEELAHVTAPMREPTRMLAAEKRLQDPNLTNEQRASNTRRKDEGRKGGPNPPRSSNLDIVDIVVCANSTLWEKYITSKQLYHRSMVQIGKPQGPLVANIKDRSDEVPWSTGSRPTLGPSASTQVVPQVPADVGEAWLWHGSNPGALDSIQKDGFNPEFSANKGSDTNPRYGVLGQGAYLADNSSKPQTYFACPQCEDPECRDPTHPPRQMMVARSLVGSPDFAHFSVEVPRLGTIGHGRRGETPKNTKDRDQKKGFTSVMSPGIKKNPTRAGATGTNEFVFKNKSMLYPEIRVYYRPA